MTINQRNSRTPCLAEVLLNCFVYITPGIQHVRQLCNSNNARDWLSLSMPANHEEGRHQFGHVVCLEYVAIDSTPFYYL